MLFLIFFSWVDAKGYQLKWFSEIFELLCTWNKKKENLFPLPHCFPLIDSNSSSLPQTSTKKKYERTAIPSGLLSSQSEQHYSAEERGLDIVALFWCRVQCGHTDWGIQVISLIQKLWWELWVQGLKNKRDNRTWKRDKCLLKKILNFSLICFALFSVGNIHFCEHFCQI